MSWLMILGLAAIVFLIVIIFGTKRKSQITSTYE